MCTQTELETMVHMLLVVSDDGASELWGVGVPGVAFVVLGAT